MATITKRGPYQFQAIVRRKGYPSQTRTFETQQDAKDWASTIESEMRRGLFIDRTEAERTTLGEILARYRVEISPTHKGTKAEIYRLKQFEKHPLALRTLATLRGTDFAEYRDTRLTKVSPKTVSLELSLMSSVLNTAKKDWSIPVENPIPQIRKPKLPPHRERRLLKEEEDRLLEAAAKSHSKCLTACIVLAVETGMRRGEIASLTWDQIDLKKHIITLTETKNGDKRKVPLSQAAENALRALARNSTHGRITSYHDSNGLGCAFRRACKQAEIEDLHFHDLRHEAASRLAKKVDTLALSKIMGWKTLQMAMRYYNPHGEELVDLIRTA